MRVGVFGLGLMGRAAVERLVLSGIETIGYARRSLEPLTLHDPSLFRCTSDASDVVNSSDLVILFLSDYDAITSVFSNVTPTSFAGKIICQMGTISPQQTISLSEVILSRGGEYLDCPVLGSLPEVKTGKLLIMIGSANSGTYNTAKPILDVFSISQHLLGGIGTAAAAKLAFNHLIGTLTAAFSTTLSYVIRHDIPLDNFMEILRDSALYAPTFDKKLSKMLAGDFKNPNFPTKHLLKDMELFISDAMHSNVDTTISEAACDIVRRTVASSKANDDYSSLFTVVNGRPRLRTH